MNALAAGQMLNPSPLDWAVEGGSLAVAIALLAWSLWRPRRSRRDDSES